MYLSVFSKGINALELIFTLFILIITSLVVIRMVTQYVTVQPITGPIKMWTDSYNYQAARAQCESMCDNFRKDCDSKAAVDFCLAKAQVDLNKDTKVGQKGVGNIVTGVPYCEDGIYCFHIYPNCECGQTLTATDCLQILCNYFQSAVGYDAETSMKAIISEIGYGTCNPNTVKNNVTGKTADSWWRDAGYDSVSCAELGKKKITSTTTTGQLSKFTLSNCQVDSSSFSFTCSATGTCSLGSFDIVDSANVHGGSVQGITSSTLQGTFGTSSTEQLTPGTCTFSYTCQDAGKQQIVAASGCTIS